MIYPQGVYKLSFIYALYGRICCHFKIKLFGWI